jgi:AcrR family transcriptional regulator
MSGWRPLPHRKPRARFNGTTFQVRRKGYKTVAQICEAAGVPNTTLRRWLGSRVPELPLIDGIRAIGDEDFDEYVEICRREYLSSRRTRNKAKAEAAARASTAGRETA